MTFFHFEEGPKVPGHVHKKQLLNHVIDGCAKMRPSVTFAEFPIPETSYDKGFRRISWRDLANAVNGVATWLTKTLGPGQKSPTLAYYGPNDIRYNALLLGAIKAGYKAKTYSY